MICDAEVLSASDLRPDLWCQTRDARAPDMRPKAKGELLGHALWFAWNERRLHGVDALPLSKSLPVDPDFKSDTRRQFDRGQGHMGLILSC